MHTYSHLIQTAWLRSALIRRGRNPRWSLLLGSFLPDVPLMLLTAWFAVQLRLAGEGGKLFGPAYDALYFGDPVWIASHNFLHAPLLVGAGLVGGRWLWLHGRPEFGRWLFWFALGCGIHSGLDIATHHNDGPLLLFPLDRTRRFQSPFSYWHPGFHAREVSRVEHLLDAVAVVAMLWPRVSNWMVRLRTGDASGQTD